MSVSDDEMFQGDASLLPDGDDARFHQRARTALLRETLQLANFSAVTQAAVAVGLAWMFWDVAPKAYLAALGGTRRSGSHAGYSRLGSTMVDGHAARGHP